jgi:beta-lactamase class A
MSYIRPQYLNRKQVTQMGRIFLFALIAFGSLGTAAKAVPADALEQARAEIQQLISASGAEKVGVAVYDLQTKKTLLINERESMHAASTMKLPVMMEIFRQVTARRLTLGDPIEVKNKFYSLADGSQYRLSKEDDSDEEVYRHPGGTMTVGQLVNHMITWSSNLATNLLIEKVTAERVTELARQLGASDTYVRRGVEDNKAFRAGLNNTTTAYDLMLLLRLIAEKKFLNSRACEQMIEILSAQHFNDGIPAGLPTGTRVAHKTGVITNLNHDAAIVYAPGRKPYVIVVLTRGISSARRSDRLIADISRTVYRALSAGA